MADLSFKYTTTEPKNYNIIDGQTIFYLNKQETKDSENNIISTDYLGQVYYDYEQQRYCLSNPTIGKRANPTEAKITDVYNIVLTDKNQLYQVGGTFRVLLHSTYTTLVLGDKNHDGIIRFYNNGSEYYTKLQGHNGITHDSTVQLPKEGYLLAIDSNPQFIITQQLKNKDLVITFD